MQKFANLLIYNVILYRDEQTDLPVAVFGVCEY